MSGLSVKASFCLPFFPLLSPPSSTFLFPFESLDLFFGWIYTSDISTSLLLKIFGYVAFLEFDIPSDSPVNEGIALLDVLPPSWGTFNSLNAQHYKFAGLFVGFLIPGLPLKLDDFEEEAVAEVLREEDFELDSSGALVVAVELVVLAFGRLVAVAFAEEDIVQDSNYHTYFGSLGCLQQEEYFGYYWQE